MKLVITSQGNDLSSKVDPRFGRAAHFVLYDTSDDSFQVLSNGENIKASHRVGVQAVETIAALKPDIVVSGNFGPKASEALVAAGIETAVYTSGTIQDVIELVKNDGLEPFKNTK